MQVDQRAAGAAPTVTAPLAGPGEPIRDAEFGYQPALDGLRGVALLAIVAFHAQVPGAQGAFLGVSTFFTLSGFLITTITLADHRRSGRVPIRHFYARRARRLLPAALVAIASIVALTVTVGVASQIVRLRSDALAALFYVTNWRQIAAGDSYGAIFTSPSMFVHFWSLGIEEQFYVVFPLALAGALWLGRGSRRVLIVGTALVAVASTAWSTRLVAEGAGVDRAYFGTDTRLAELAIGCLLALLWDRWRAARPAASALGNGNGRGPLPRPGPLGHVIEWAGVAALAGLILIWHAVDRTDTGLYQGGLAVHALLTSVVILAAVRPRGPIRRLLGWRPLVAVGAISYGAYLIHWPIMVVLSQQTALPWEGRLVVALPLTLVLATLSYRLLERPIRSRRWPPPRVAPAVAAGALATVAVAVVGVTAWRTVPPATDFQAAARQFNGVPAGSDIKSSFEKLAAAEGRISSSNAPRIAFFGDSSAMMTGIGLGEWTLDHLDELAPGPGAADLGCGLIETGRRRVEGQTETLPATCKGWKERWTATTATHRIDIAVIQFGPWEVRDQQLTKGGPWLTIGKDPELDAALEDNLDAAVRDLLGHVGEVMLVAPPDLEFGRDGGRSPAWQRPESDPARMARYRQIVRDVAARHEHVAVIDLAAYLNRRSDDKALRPDGIHFTEAASRRVADWLGPEILRLYERDGRAPAH